MSTEGMPIRITVVASYYPPDFSSLSNYYKDIVYDLSRYGADVTLVCGIPTRLVAAEITKQYAMNQDERIYKNLRIIRTGPKRSEGSSLFYRALYHIYRSWCIYSKSKKIRTDIYFVCSAPPFLGIYGAWLAKRTKVIYDLQDLFPDTLVCSGKMKENSLLIRVLRNVEKYIYCRCTHIRIISKDMANTLYQRGVPCNKTSIIYNWVDECKVTYIDRQNNPIFDMLKIPRDGYYVCYAGNIGLLQNLSTLIEAARITETLEPMIRFIIIGDGVWKPKMMRLIAEKRLTNIQTFPMQDTKYVPNIYNIGDVGVVTIGRGVTRGSLPSKTWNILSASCPIVCEVDEGSELQEIITKNQCGLCVSPGDNEGLAKAIMTLKSNKELSAFMGKNGRAFIENNITRKESTKRIMECIMKVYNESL